MENKKFPKDNSLLAGVNCILIHSKSSDEIVAFVKAWDRSVPLVLVPTTYPQLTEKQIRAVGKVKMVFH